MLSYFDSIPLLIPLSIIIMKFILRLNSPINNKGVDDFRLFHELNYQLVSASSGYSGYNILVHLRVGF